MKTEPTELDKYKALCKRLSDALLKVRPLGGSELFTKIGEGDDQEYYADPDYCGKAIEKLRQDLHEARAALYTGKI